MNHNEHLFRANLPNYMLGSPIIEQEDGFPKYVPIRPQLVNGMYQGYFKGKPEAEPKREELKQEEDLKKKVLE
jgi:hypothetical protein